MIDEGLMSHVSQDVRYNGYDVDDTSIDWQVSVTHTRALES